MKILKLKLFQESACYKKPFAFKVSETYPLPPYSTVIGMFHKIIGAKSGEYYPMNISIQGDYESVFSDYQSLKKFKRNVMTTMPMYVHKLLNVNLIIHMQAEDEIVDKIYESIINGRESFTLGRNEDIVRVDLVKVITDVNTVYELIPKHSIYIPTKKYENVNGINYRLNTKKWEKVNVVYIEKDNFETIADDEIMVDEDGDVIMFYE
mgnify:CR=1 FL=1